MMRFDTGELRLFANHLELAHHRAPMLARQRVAAGGRLLLRNITLRAQSRPGPRRLTGDYVASWGMDTDTDRAGNARATAGTNHAAGFRLERGFHGTDSLGRTFVDSPGYPHVTPGTRATEDPYFAMVEKLADDLL